MIITSALKPASSRATARPAKLAPQISTSWVPSRAVRSSPRLVARTGIRRRVPTVRGGEEAPRIFLPLFAAVSTSDTLTPPAPTGIPVDGSNGLLVEIDGKVVPNYAATMVSFEEGDVVNGKVVRIDKDE